MRRRFMIGYGLLLSGLACAISGLVVQIKYHMGHHVHVDVVEAGHATWAQVHKISSIVLLLLVLWHLILNWKWLRTVWNKGLVHKHRQLATLTICFAAAALTGIGAWALGVGDAGFRVEKIVVEIHDKITLVLFVLLLLHVWNRRNRLASPSARRRAPSLGPLGL